MNNTSFPLKKNLILPATGNPNKGYLLFPAQMFSLSYDVTPRPKQQQIDIALTVSETSTEDTVWILGIYKITEDGFRNQTNYEEYSQYLADKTALEVILSSKEAELEIANSNLQIDETTLPQYEIAEAAWQEAFANLQALPIVEPIYNTINRYSEVIDYFKGDGTLTDEGIEWAKTVSFMGENLGNYI